MRVLITGITGFVGSHMAEFALAQGAEVFGSCRWRSKTENIDHLRSRISLIESDLRDMSSTRALVERADPTYVVHLAAQAASLRAAGLDRITVSLDTLRADRFERLSRSRDLPAVLAGIGAAAAAFGRLKIDTVVIRGENDDETCRTPFTHQLDASVGYDIPIGSTMKLNFNVTVFNFLNFQEAVLVDQEYTTDVVLPQPEGTRLADVRDPDGNPISVNPTFGEARLRQEPLTVRLGARFSF